MTVKQPATSLRDAAGKFGKISGVDLWPMTLTPADFFLLLASETCLQSFMKICDLQKLWPLISPKRDLWPRILLKKGIGLWVWETRCHKPQVSISLSSRDIDMDTNCDGKLKGLPTRVVDPKKGCRLTSATSLHLLVDMITFSFCMHENAAMKISLSLFASGFACMHVCVPVLLFNRQFPE